VKRSPEFREHLDDLQRESVSVRDQLQLLCAKAEGRRQPRSALLVRQSPMKRIAKITPIAVIEYSFMVKPRLLNFYVFFSAR